MSVALEPRMRFISKPFVIGGAVAGVALLGTAFFLLRRRRKASLDMPLDLSDPDVVIEEVTVYGIPDVYPPETPGTL